MTIRANAKFSLPLPKHPLGLITAAISACLLAFSVQADPISDFYTGRTINIMVGFGPGGGYDL
jgi:tripartite-type tricarboxylate transporter receptor subunit TctC